MVRYFRIKHGLTQRQAEKQMGSKNSLQLLVHCQVKIKRKKMNTLENMLRNVSGRHYNKINKACQPLFDHFGVNNVSYHKLKSTGEYYCLGNNVEWLEYFFSEGYYLHQPHFRHPKNFQNNISLPNYISDENYQHLLRIHPESNSSSKLGLKSQPLFR